jgi:hypothetical protein
VTGNLNATGTLGVTGAATVGGTLGVTGNVAVNTNKFTVEAATGNTAVAGNVAVNTDKFTVEASSGNTAIAGSLAVTGETKVTALKHPSSATNNLVLNQDGSVNISGSNYSPQTGFKNRIINGGMVIAQRGTGVVSTDGSFPVDRWYAFNQAGAFTAQQVTDVPTGAGFINSILWSPGNTTARNYSGFEQRIEGFNVSDLDWGSASAKAITVSFWVKAGVTATLSVTAGNGGGTRAYPATYTINAANTWEYKTVTIPGDTSGTWLKDNGTGLRLWFTAGGTSQQTGNAWGSGSAANCATGTTALYAASANLWITGVQLEKSSTATPFEFRSIGTELGLCERYYEILSPISVMFPWDSGAQVIRSASSFRTTKRASPSISLNTKTSGTGTLSVATAYTTGVDYAGTGGSTDVVTYAAPTASAEL